MHSKNRSSGRQERLIGSFILYRFPSFLSEFSLLCFFIKIEVLRANGGVYCVNEASGIRMDVFIARGDLFLTVSWSFSCFYAFFVPTPCLYHGILL